jgi:hypothetical protein
MGQSSDKRASLLSTMTKMGVFIWMAFIILLFLIMFSPTEFVWITQRLGFSETVKVWHDGLLPLLTAGYKQ